jgi:hypothetical protein
MMRAVKLVLVAVLAWPVAAFADPADDGGTSGTEHPPIKNRINFRVGAATTDTNGHPTICLDVRVVRGFGIESCGTGQALLHDDPGYEMAHFRGTYSLLEGPVWKGTGHVRGGLGFAEMQVGIDHPGFQFGSPDKDRGSVSGPEASLSGQLLLPLYKGVDFVMTGTAGLALFQHADELVQTKSNLQSFVSVEAGIGW